LTRADAQKAVDTCEGFYVTTQQGSRGWAEYHLSRSLFASGELNESEDIIRHAFSLFGEVNDEWSEGHCYELLGQILMKKKQFAEALQYNQKAWDIKEKLSGLDNMASNLVARGNIYREMGDEERAVKYYKQAAETYQKRNCFKMEKKVLAIIEGKKDTWF
jgi:Tetratricopeptide repeat.